MHGAAGVGSPMKRESGGNPERTRHCERFCVRLRTPSASSHCESGKAAMRIRCSAPATASQETCPLRRNREATRPWLNAWSTYDLERLTRNTKRSRHGGDRNDRRDCREGARYTAHRHPPARRRLQKRCNLRRVPMRPLACAEPAARARPPLGAKLLPERARRRE
jgi:hypothetical protein